MLKELPPITLKILDYRGKPIETDVPMDALVEAIRVEICNSEKLKWLFGTNLKAQVSIIYHKEPINATH